MDRRTALIAGLVQLAAVAVLAIAGSTAVYAQHRHWSHGHMRMNPEDRAAFADARIAAVHAGLKLTADQEKLWPPLEAAVKDFAKLRIDRANARMNSDRNDRSLPDDPVVRLRERADNMATSAAAMKRGTPARRHGETISMLNHACGQSPPSVGR